MKEFSVDLGGKVRPLKFHTLDALDLKKRFGKGARELIFEDTLGIPGKPGPDGRFVANAFLQDQEVQLFVLFLALRRGGAKVSENQLIEWVDEYVKPPAEGEATKDFGDLVAPAAKAALYSGAITGRSLDIDEASEEDGEGKASPGSGGAA